MSTETLSKNIAPVFMQKLRKVESGCWQWQLHLSAWNGYGTFKLEGVRHRAHRASWIIFVGSIPDGLLVLHRCDNPGCVNPEHLFLGTQQENMDDMRSKGRDNYTGTKTALKGSANPRAKLTDEKVLQIKHLISVGINGADIARRFSVDRALIYRIRDGRSWSHVI